MLRVHALVSVLLVGAPAYAGARGAVRFGVLPLELDASTDTPLFGDDISRAVNAYNAAAAAYDRAHATSTEPIDASDLALRDTLLVISPGVELGTGLYFFRLEAPLGFGSKLRSYGAGVYPLNLNVPIAPSTAVYVSVGGTASYLDRTGASDDMGALVSARFATGLRFSHTLVELGYNAFALGGTVDSSKLDAMTIATTDAPPPRPDTIVAAGEARGLVDLSVGLAF